MRKDISCEDLQQKLSGYSLVKEKCYLDQEKNLNDLNGRKTRYGCFGNILKRTRR